MKQWTGPEMAKLKRMAADGVEIHEAMAELGRSCASIAWGCRQIGVKIDGMYNKGRRKRSSERLAEMDRDWLKLYKAGKKAPYGTECPFPTNDLFARCAWMAGKNDKELYG